MNYLVINHIPFAIAGPARFRTTSAMLDDLRAQSAALSAAGMRMMLAAPVVPPTHVAARRCDSVEFSPDQVGFELLHLPVYQSMRAYLRVKSALAEALRAAIAAADIVQMGYGGHPMMLGEVAFPIARQAGRRVVWNFDAIDPFPRMKSAAGQDRSLLRRVMKDRLIEHKIRFCRRAVATADLVLAHHPDVATRFASVWSERCHVLAAALFAERYVITEAELAARAASAADKTRAIRLACIGPQPGEDPADHIIRAVAHCRRLSVPVELTVIAPADSARALLQLARELGMQQHVHRLDPPPPGATWMGAMMEIDAIVSTAPTGVCEPALFGAMSRGVPVLAYENPATDRMLEERGAGVVVPGGNVLLLAQAMIDLHRDRRRIDILGRGAVGLAQTRTAEAVHRRRAEIVATLRGRRSEHAA